MEKITNLILALEQCIPGLNSGPLHAAPPLNSELGNVLDWLYQQLSEQNLIQYEEWKEYSGNLPALAPLSKLALPDDHTDFIYSLIGNIDWENSEIEQYEIPYVMPWLENSNYYLKPYDLKLVDLIPFENAYILCLRNDDAAQKNLHSCLEVFGMGINERDAMDHQQITAAIESLTKN